MGLGRFELNKVYCEDSYKAIKEIPDKCIDCIYTDIPYLFHIGFENDALRNDANDLKTINDGIDYSILDDFVRILKNINCFIWCSKQQIPYILNYFMNKNCFFEILTWNKSNCSPLTNNTWLPDIEYCLYFRETGVKLNDGYELKSKWFSSPINKRDKEKFQHPTIKPVELVERHLLHTTQPNDIVFDPFVGSGTTCIASMNIGRKCLGFEIEKKWADIANDRLNNIDANGQYSFILK